jgi:hypothetical protein
MRKFWLAFIGVGAAFFADCMTIALAQAEDSYNKELFGHRVRIVDKDYMERLTIDGKTVVKNRYVSIDGKHTIAGVGVLIGSSSGGGTICPEPAIFVVSFPKARPFRLHGPKGDCGTITYEVEKDTIRFLRSKAYKPKIWTWTPDKGMSAEADVNLPNSFQDSDLWQDISAGRVDHPLLLFSHPQMKEAIKAWMGKDEDRIAHAAFGAGDVEHKGDLFVAKACANPNAFCDDEQIIFVFDTKAKERFVAWKLFEKPPVVKPAAEQWSPLARAELDEWLKRWDKSEASPTPSISNSNAVTDDLLNDLRNQHLSKPEEVFNHPDMVIPIETLLLGYRETVMSMVRGGQGTVDDKGNVIVGTSCLPDECSDKSLMFVLDPTSKHVFFAWKTPGNPVAAKPPVKEWPQPAKAELTAWSKRWTEAAQNGGKKPQ